MLVLLVLVLIATTQAIEHRIIGGDVTSIEDYPYQVSIIYDNTHDCGGSIISKQWILTAAHCVYGRTFGSLKIRVGSSYSNSGGQVIGIKKVIHHPQYDQNTFDYDIALLQLSSQLVITSSIDVINLASPATLSKSDSVGVVTGWGYITPNGQSSDVLRVLEIPIIDRKQCENIYAAHNTVTSRMLCGGYLEGGKDTCRGDSGGPLVYNGIQIGIVSWGAQCASPGYPGVYTRVSALRSWITRWTNV